MITSHLRKKVMNRIDLIENKKNPARLYPAGEVTI
jgi:hypothetical protein